MRAAFGLVSLLVCVGIIALLMKTVLGPVTSVGGKAQEQVEIIGGVAPESGKHVEDTYALSVSQRPDGRLIDLRLVNMDIDSPLKTSWGFMINDKIVKVTDSHGVPNDIRDQQDETAARLLVRDACSFGGEFVVDRGGTMYTLAKGKAPQLEAGAVPPVTPPAQNTPPTASQQPQQTPPPANQKNNPPQDDDHMKEINQRLRIAPSIQ